MRVIGLTGGIATGKSTAANYLARHYQLPILDADVYARQAVEPPSEILQTIQERYGQEILTAIGQLRRDRLAEIIFADSQERQWLEQQIHPIVRQRLIAEIQQAKIFPVICVVPLLLEAGMEDIVSEIWVVTCNPDQQLARLQQRNSLSFAQAQARITSQIPLAEKIARADVVLDNSRGQEELYAQIDHAITKFGVVDL